MVGIHVASILAEFWYIVFSELNYSSHRFTETTWNTSYAVRSLGQGAR
jgi:hypothetical protein